MGYTSSAIHRILNDKNLFLGKKILTLGTLYPYLSPKEYKSLIPYGISEDIPKEQFSKYLFVELLGAEACHSLDVSDYQQSEIICNLNHPLPENLLGQYDVIIDAGTLEHLSNLSVALKNLFDLLKKGGIYYFGTPCNNWVDHGFFQFSPTFFIDLCIDSPGLELSSLYLSTAQKNYYFFSLKPAVKMALYTSSVKLGVTGVIKKNSNLLNLDLTQSKYRDQHQKTLISNNITTTNKTLIKLINKFSMNPYIPFSFKEIVLEILYKLKK